MSEVSSEADDLGSDFLTRVTDAQLAVAAIVAILAPLLIAISVDEANARVLASLIAVPILGAAYLVWRKVRKKRALVAARQRRIRKWADRPLEAGFRGLYSYTRTDELPSEQRRRLAKRIATQIAHPTFTYGVVSGDIGVGKSSLLDSGVARALESGGFSVVLVRGLRSLSRVDSLDDLFQEIRGRLTTSSGDPVLIFDQFEEALIRWTSSDSRRRLGVFLGDPLDGKSVRVVCGLRSDYIISLHDLRPGIADPTSSKILFPIANFDENEAFDVIQECAERDGLSLDKSFIRSLAADLSHTGKVRPPELQLVCTAMEFGDPQRSYSMRGRAAGILSDYVDNAITSSIDERVARQILRSLCDFTIFPPAKAQPISIVQLADLLGFKAKRDEGYFSLQEVIDQLIGAGLVAMLGTRGHFTYTLVHDYLVHPIALATAEASTQSERATQLLRFHLAESEADPRATIPARRLSIIEDSADRVLVMTSEAQSLLYRSWIRMKIKNFLIIVCFGASFSAVIYAVIFPTNIPLLRGTGFTDAYTYHNRMELDCLSARIMAGRVDDELDRLEQEKNVTREGRVRTINKIRELCPEGW